ncbi:MAG: hypothetical protein QNJ30_25905 [Kiloniellales bacterium]|nr:hypothetical protein [Kiloniellales bacterium]
MKLPLPTIERICIGLILAVIALRLWHPGGEVAPNQAARVEAASSCAEAPTVSCLLARAREAADEIEVEKHRREVECTIATAVGRAGMAEEAIAILEEPNIAWRCLFNLREVIFDGLRKAGDRQAIRQVLSSVGRDLERLDRRWLFILARNWIEIGEIERGLSVLDRALAKEQEERKACLEERSDRGRSHCKRANYDAISTQSIVAALFIAGRHSEGQRILATQETPGWQIQTLKETAKRAVLQADARLGGWALRRVLTLTAGLSDSDLQLLHLKDVYNLAGDLGREDIASNALQSHRALAASWVSATPAVDPLIRLARLEAKAGHRERARNTLRQAFDIAVGLPRSPDRRPPGIGGVRGFAPLLLQDEDPEPPDLPPLPRNPRREALGEIASELGRQGFLEDLREVLAAYAEEVHSLEHPLHRAETLVYLAAKTRRLSEARARELLLEAKAFIDGQASQEKRRQAVEDLASSVYGSFGFETMEEIFGQDIAQQHQGKRFFWPGLKAVRDGRYAEALDHAERLTDILERFRVASRAFVKLSAGVQGVEQRSLLDRATEVMQEAIRQAEASDDRYARALSLASFAYDLAEAQ